MPPGFSEPLIEYLIHLICAVVSEPLPTGTLIIIPGWWEGKLAL